MKKFALIVAAGESRRMGGSVPKPFQQIAGKLVLYYSMRAFWEAFPEAEMVVVRPPDYHQQISQMAEAWADKKLKQVDGGRTRFQSVRQGLASIEEEGVVWVHDAARPLVRPALIRRLYEDCLRQGSAIPVIPAIDSYRQLETEGGSRSLDRTALRLVQTPQTFMRSTLLEAMAQEERETFTDEATVVEHLGRSVFLSEGQTDNMKITWPGDLSVAEALIQREGR